MKRAASLRALLIIAAVVLGACRGSTATPAASTGPPPLGTFALRNSNQPESLTLLDGGQYKISIQGINIFNITGSWIAKQDQLSFTETGGARCTGVTGTYTWSYDGTYLKLTLVKDECPERPAHLASPGGWVKQP